MNYGKHATEKKIRSANSKARKYTTKVFLAFIKSLFVLCLFGGIVAASVGIGMVKGIIDNTPNVDISTIVPNEYASTVYDSAGNVTETLVTAGSNREEATYEELPKNLINAFVAYEDSRYWEHNGIDLRSILRAIRGVLTGDSSAGGGSTITQQLIKNSVFGGGMEKSFGERLERKFQEWYLAVKLDGAMSKEQIITNYLNTINLGNNTLGVKVAAKRYFNKDVKDLSLSECAVLAGITQNPSKFNPISEQKANAAKRKVILQYMNDQGYISNDEEEKALADDVYSRIQNVDTAAKETSTPYSYFTDELVEQVIQAMKSELGYTETQAHNMLYSGGLSIYTTQDPNIQSIVDEEINNPENYSAARYSIEYRLSVTHKDGTTKHYSDKNVLSFHKEIKNQQFDGLYNNEDEINADINDYKAEVVKDGDTIIGERLHKTLEPQASFVLMDQHTGEVKAISGGRGPKVASLTLNRATGTFRQPGSTFKILTSFAPAMDTSGATLGTVYYDSLYKVGNKTFSNWYSSGYQGYSSIRDGIVYSMNIVAVRCLMETVTPQLGVEYAKNFGITSLTDTDFNPALALGGITKGVSNLELTGAFATVANGGVYTKPVFFTKILDHDGKILIENKPETHRVLKDSTAFLLTDAMADSMKSSRKFSSNGPSSTSTAASIPGMSAAGKSGTTSANNDIWFVGYSPYYTAGIWGGCDDNQKLTKQNGGTSFHKAIWRKIMTRVHEGMSDPGFPVPDSVETAQICRKSGKLAVTGVCTDDPRGNAVYTEYFAKGTVPTEVCNNHVRATVCSVSHKLPTPYCPVRTTAVFIALPSGDETATDDSKYAMPGYCTIHSANSFIIPPGNDTEVPEAGEDRPSQSPPGYVPQTPGGVFGPWGF
ncbi:penicillin-binding protein [Lacrimispora xylanolytica]|jgi:penicillin-binding protein 1A|uniref:transglycosylase domain-containing protein n=1 Tax=Clostridium sp. 12(A) TaxID=1163671 RepID=UPI0004667CB8|nr:transglycosylase domain-containing protein [Clostridium sp. 12(A)]MBS5959299.1 transglycosylase domain-containing protein [Clostridiales bacterium]